MLLALDTATRNASIALYDETGVLAETTWCTRENHTVELMAQIVHLLDLAHAPKSDLRAIGVALGPGSFTGLRVGMSVAKGLAYGCAIPLFGVPTLDAVARPHAFQPSPIWAILIAGRGRFSIARYTPYRGAVTRASDYALVNVEDLLDLVARAGDDSSSPMLFCGDVDAALANRLTERFAARAVIASPAMNARRAGFIAELAWARFRRGESDDVAALAPLYAPFKIQTESKIK